MGTRFELSVRQITMIENNSSAMGTTPSVMIGRLVDDEFGGLLVTANNGSSPRAIHQHIESLESILRTRTR